MNWQEHRKALEALSPRDKKILDLARRATNALGFALQNTHSDRIVEKYERQSEEALRALEELLITRWVDSAAVAPTTGGVQ